jgi:peptidoglycan/xylan/chitin deacetylase (PgdA/CDA1 family)
VPDRAVNLTFHGVGAPVRPFDPGEAEVWVKHEHFLSVLDSVAGRDDVRITFDDGNASDVEHALPALQARGLRATFFVVAGRLGSPGFLDAAGVRELQAAGMTIGCHGMRHRPWRGLDEQALHEELVDAKRTLEGITGVPVKEAACPFGSYDRKVLRFLRRSGYGHVYTSDRGMARPGDWIQTRNTIHAEDDPKLLDGILEGDGPAHWSLRQRAKLVAKRWR